MPVQLPEVTPHQIAMTNMLVAMRRTGRPIYLGTADPKAVAKRRARNKAARRARQAARR